MVEFGEWLCEEVLKYVPHRQWVFSPPEADVPYSQTAANPLLCPKCLGSIRIISFIDGELVKKILEHLGLWEVRQRPPPQANAPPLNIHMDYTARPGATRLPVIAQTMHYSKRDFLRIHYETIGGGAGAGNNWHGQSGVHTHMTNTRITDPEILDRRYPVLLKKFSLRKDSGDKGKHYGGDGLVREMEFLSPLNAAILSERRVYPPYGLNGGGNGKPGKNLFIEKTGKTTDLGEKSEVKAGPGDRIRILTPGGGGFGEV